MISGAERVRANKALPHSPSVEIVVTAVIAVLIAAGIVASSGPKSPGEQRDGGEIDALDEMEMSIAPLARMGVRLVNGMACDQAIRVPKAPTGQEFAKKQQGICGQRIMSHHRSLFIVSSQPGCMTFDGK